MEKEKQVGLTAKKEENFSEWYTQVIQKADLIEYTLVSGCYVFKPNSYSIWEKVQNYLNKHFKELGVKNAYFPLFIPESVLKKEASHIEGFNPEVAWVTQAGNTKLSEKLAIRPTSESIMYDAYSKWIRSYRDLPLKLNQWANIVRWEFKTPLPFLRSREFLWQEGHTVYATKEEADKEVKQILDLYEKVYEELFAIPVLKGQKTEKEKFAGALYTTSIEVFLPNGKAIQAATSHALGQNFAKAFNIEFLDKNSKKQFAWQNSWGLTTRSLGILTIMHSDNKGFVMPPKVAHTQVVIIPILFDKEKEKIIKQCEKIKKDLSNFSVELDLRESYSPGWKFNEHELKGIPLRIELGPKDLEKNQAVLVRRDTGEKIIVKLKDVKKKAENLLDDIQNNLLNKAKDFMEKNTVETSNLNDLEKALNNKKLAKAFWCENQECENKIRQKIETSKILNVPFDQPKSMKNCLICNKKAQKLVYIAKSY
ncbi:MAG: proline--tRNA ligase [Nanoarchaeota archaeon]